MGLGKTLQTICLLATYHYSKMAPGDNKMVGKNKMAGDGKMAAARCQSLVVCPATLGGHWVEEINKFVGKEFLDPFLYIGNLATRKPTVEMHTQL